MGPASSCLLEDAVLPTIIGTAARGRFEINREMRPHIVDVFPVPGGLKKTINIIWGIRKERNYPWIRENPAVFSDFSIAAAWGSFTLYASIVSRSSFGAT